MAAKINNIIIDTDMDTDCDDVGATTLAHRLASQGKANLIGMICDTNITAAAVTIDYINHYFGRGTLPIGKVEIEDYQENPRYHPYIRHSEAISADKKYHPAMVREFEQKGYPAGNYPSASTLYRKLLARSEDQSVVICAIGLLTALAQLVLSGPDEISPLTGIELIRAKVKKLVTMAEISFPGEGEEVFNWQIERTGAETVLCNWPTELVVSSFGKEVLTGAAALASCAQDHPVSLAYHAFLSDQLLKNRSSWDQIAVLYGILGRMDLFEELGGYTLHYDGVSNRYQWIPAPESKHKYLRPLISNEELANYIEALMV